MSLTQAKKMTAEEFETLGPEWFELDEGEPTPMPPPPAPIHGEVAAEIVALLKAHVRQHRLGRVLGEAAYRLSESTVRGPDASFVRAERVPPGGMPERGSFPGAPDLAVEIVSQRDREHPGAMLRKVGQYLEAGTSVVWVVDPRARRVAVYGGAELVQVLGPDDTLTGEPVLPGFRCAVGELFPER